MPNMQLHNESNNNNRARGTLGSRWFIYLFVLMTTRTPPYLHSGVVVSYAKNVVNVGDGEGERRTVRTLSS